MNIKAIFSGSLLLNLIWGGLCFIEGSVRESRILRGLFLLLDRIYPERILIIFDQTNKRLMGRLANDFFAPIIIFPLFYILFVVVSNYRLSNLGVLTTATGLIFFAVGTKTGRRGFKRISLEEHATTIAVLFSGLGLIFLALDLAYAGAIPLFEPAARSKLNVTYTMLAQLLPPGAIIGASYFGCSYKKGRMGLRESRILASITLFGALTLIALLGFRTQINIVLLGGVIAMYLTGLIGFSEVVLGLAAALLGIIGVGYLRAVEEGSALGVFQILSARIGLTLSVYDHLVKRFMPFGANKGYTLLASFSSYIPGLPGPKLGPRTIVARLFGVKGISMTSTMLGTIVLDLGIIGVIIFMLLLGHVLGTTYNAAKEGSSLGTGVYSLLLAYSLVGVETGLVDFNVLMMFALGYALIRSSH